MKKLWYKLRVKAGMLPRRYAVKLKTFGIHPTDHIVIETHDRDKVTNLAVHQHMVDGNLGVISEVTVVDVTFDKYFNDYLWTTEGFML